MSSLLNTQSSLNKDAHGVPDPALAAHIAKLEQQLEVQKQTNQLLIKRVARSVDIEGGVFSLREENSQLHQGIVQRSQELETINRQLRQEIIERRLVEQALRFSEERYRLLLEETEQPFIVIRELEYVYANPAAARLMGYADTDQLIAAGLRRIIAPEDLPKMAGYHARRMAGEEVGTHYEVKFVRKDGSELWCDIAAQIGEYDSQSVSLIALHDVTERKRNAAELAQSLSLVQATLESTADGIVVTDSQRRVVTYNRTFSQMWRIPEDVLQSEAEAEGIFEHIFSQVKDLDGFRQRIREIYNDREAESFDRIELLDGRTFERITRPQRIEGVSVGRVLSFRDITESRRAEQAVRDSEERFRRLVEASPDYIMTFSSAGRVVFVNRAPGGTPAENLIGLSGLRFVKQSFHASMSAALEEVFTHDELREVEFQGADERWYFARLTPVHSRDNEQQAMAIVTNITDRKRAEEQQAALELQLRQAQKMEAIGTLAGGIAHDFNNILYAIQGYAELVLDELPEQGTVRQDQQEVLVAARRAADLVKQILAFSRQTKSELVPVGVHNVVREVLHLMRASLPSTINVERDITAPQATVLGDPTQLHQVILNLCTNAGHAMAESGGTLRIGLHEQLVTVGSPAAALRSPGNYVVISIEDNGCGIPQDVLDRIFDPFFTTKDVGVGTGLGLSTVHGIVAAMSGDIAVQSTVGEGTTFEVFLPLVAPATDVKEALEERSIGAGEHILFVEDEAALAKMAREALKRLGYNVTACTNSVEAWELFEADPAAFDLIVTDQTMPALTGSELAKRVLRLRPAMPIILCTGYSATIDEQTALEIGMKAYLNKPVGISDLARKVREVLDASTVAAA